MPHAIQKRQAFLGLGGGFIIAWILVSGIIAAIIPARAQAADSITNVAQLTQALNLRNQLVGNLELDGTVYAYNTNTGALILQDATGAELLEMDDLKDDLKPGDLVHIEAKPGLLSAGDFGIYVATPPLIDNDGVHGPQAAHGEHYFEAGRHLLRLDWFNQRLGSDLEVSCVPSGSGAKTSATKTAETNFLK
jgi:hypothetical protein